LPEGFQADEDTWYFPRVCGTFRERQGFHGCQMPEQLLGRIIRACSRPGELVVDPFAGSGTTLAVAKKLGRRFLGFELSPQYTEKIRERLARIQEGDALEGSSEPLSGGRPSHNLRRPSRRAHVHDSYRFLFE
ncbi:DNA-methyltransferase, partial [Thermogutta sp.]